LHLIVLHI